MCLFINWIKFVYYTLIHSILRCSVYLLTVLDCRLRRLLNFLYFLLYIHSPPKTCLEINNNIESNYPGMIACVCIWEWGMENGNLKLIQFAAESNIFGIIAIWTGFWADTRFLGVVRHINWRDYGGGIPSLRPPGTVFLKVAVIFPLKLSHLN